MSDSYSELVSMARTFPETLAGQSAPLRSFGKDSHGAAVSGDPQAIEAGGVDGWKVADLKYAEQGSDAEGERWTFDYFLVVSTAGELWWVDEQHGYTPYEEVTHKHYLRFTRVDADLLRLWDEARASNQDMFGKAERAIHTLAH